MAPQIARNHLKLRDPKSALMKSKGALWSDPVLRNPDFSFQLLLQTDASERDLGAVLSQVFGDSEKYPSCASVDSSEGMQ